MVIAIKFTYRSLRFSVIVKTHTDLFVIMKAVIMDVYAVKVDFH